MAKYTAVKARKELADIINRAVYAKERVVITRKGKNVVAVVPIEDAEFLEELENRLDIEDARKALKEKGSVSFERIKKDLGLK